MFSADFAKSLKNVEWDSCGWHYNADVAEYGPLTAQYILVLDALNFCFWPVAGLEYEHLAVGLKNALMADSTAFSADRLMNADEDVIKSWIPGWEIPLMSERIERIKEVGIILKSDFEGLAANLVKQANHSACRLVTLVNNHFSGFRDTTIYQGRLIHCYKRAQIFVADLWGTYGRPTDSNHPYYFHDINTLTMFADYRIPQILRHVDILQYTPRLADVIDRKEELAFGCEEETEIQACTIIAVEMLKEKIQERHKLSLTSIEIDWLLWNWGEKVKDTIKPAHRTLTIYY